MKSSFYTVVANSGATRIVESFSIKAAHEFGRLLFPNQSFTTRESTEAEILLAEAAKERFDNLMKENGLDKNTH